MKITRRFNSVLMVYDKTRRPVSLTFEIDDAREHSFSIGIPELCKNRAWIRGLFFSIMICIPLFAFVYGFLSIVMDIALWSTEGVFVRMVFIYALVGMFILLWISISVPAAIKDLKWQTVVNERGNGNWKIVDEAKLDRFYQLVEIAQEKEEDDETEEGVLS